MNVLRLSEVTEVMKNLGIRRHVKGFNYLRYAIERTIENESAVNGITKVMYPEIAERFETKPASVEKAIRSAIEKVDRNNDLSKKIFNPFIPHYSNKEFILNVAEYIRLREMRKTTGLGD